MFKKALNLQPHSFFTRVTRLSLLSSSFHSSFSAQAQHQDLEHAHFDKILIANRGEIACRVIKTARKLGIQTVAVYSEIDARAKHVQMADESVHIGGNQSSDSYLCMDRVLEAARLTEAKGIHPGYGFLSENAKFVEMVEKRGMTFIGPEASAMNAMGDKINSKRIAKEAGCYVIPGFEGEVASADDAVRLVIEEDIGYPVMIKASAGGGGKGMRVAYNDEELREGFELSKAEAQSSFGDDRMLIERFIEDPHHIEIQVIADTHGNVAAFPERECSVQRRNQKVIEESPSMLLTEETRRKMQEQAILLCKATGYRSAGTVEMLCDSKQNFYFLEMNTRLQVEHPVTELVGNEDLVELMLMVAAGNKLPQHLIDQPFIQHNGWSIESRVYAEDPLRSFLPSIGPLLTYKEPLEMKTNDEVVRVDSGIYEGGQISMYYDPMISKLATWGNTRGQAIDLMEKALDQYVIQGLGHNISFCRDVMRNAVFKSGIYSTKFIEEQYPDGFKGVQLSKNEACELICIATVMHLVRSEKQLAKGDVDQYVVILGGPKGAAYSVYIDVDTDLAITVEKLGDNSENAETKRISKLDWMHGQPLAKVKFAVDGDSDDVSAMSYLQDSHKYVQFEGRGDDGASYILKYNGSQQEVIVRSPYEHFLSHHMRAPEKKDFSKFLLCPMPGTLISCSVEEGQTVEAGQQLAIVEAMKMQNILRAEKQGTIKAVLSTEGSHLKVDQPIVEFM